MIISMPKRPKRPRTLRSYRRVAQKDHGPCQMCGRHIKTGEEYDAYVTVASAGLRVDKFHVHCPDDFWEEEEENHRRAEAEHNKREEQSQSRKSRAA